MRTTIELNDEQRAALLSLAGKRGLRGYSPLVQEAISRYLHLPMPEPDARHSTHKTKAVGPFLDFLKTSYASGRADGAERHDDYIYRQR